MTETKILPSYTEIIYVPKTNSYDYSNMRLFFLLDRRSSEF